MNGISKLLIAAGIFGSVSASAGNWGSSGGSFLKDDSNPWFLRNVNTVSYCVVRDPSGFSANPQKIFQMIDLAIRYWKEEFAKNDSGALAGLGVQEFVSSKNGELGCNGGEDLRLHLGYGSLTPELLQEAKLQGEDFHSYVAVTIRDGYKADALRGSGFVYLSSDQGPDAYDQRQAITQGLWQYDGILYRVLVHEFGHIFGIPHAEAGFMAAGFPESTLRNFREHRVIPNHVPFFQAASSYKNCALNGFSLAAKSLKAFTPNCLVATSSNSWSSFEIELTSLEGEKVVWKSVGQTSKSNFRLDFPIRIFLPKGQSIIPNVPPSEPYLKGPARQTFTVTGKVDQTAGGPESAEEMMIQMRPEAAVLYLQDKNHHYTAPIELKP